MLSQHNRYSWPVNMDPRKLSVNMHPRMKHVLITGLIYDISFVHGLQQSSWLRRTKTSLIMEYYCMEFNFSEIFSKMLACENEN